MALKCGSLFVCQPPLVARVLLKVMCLIHHYIAQAAYRTQYRGGTS